MIAPHDHCSRDGQSSLRRFCRRDVTITADMRATGGKKNKVKVVDLSQLGFRMECLTYISDSQVLFLTLPGFQQLKSRVIWQTEWMYGCQFAHPLHPAVYDYIIKTYPDLEEGPKA